jgi:hypothetical protein
MGSVRCVDAEKPKFVIRYGTGYEELFKKTGISDANNSSIKQTDLELHVKEQQHPTKTNYDRYKTVYQCVCKELAWLAINGVIVNV